MKLNNKIILSIIFFSNILNCGENINLKIEHDLDGYNIPKNPSLKRKAKQIEKNIIERQLALSTYFSKEKRNEIKKKLIFDYKKENPSCSDKEIFNLVDDINRYFRDPSDLLLAYELGIKKYTAKRTNPNGYSVEQLKKLIKN